MVADESAIRPLSRLVLLAAVRPDPAVFTRLLAAEGARADWPWIVERATFHKVAALLAFRLERLGAMPPLPSALQARLEHIRREAADRAARAQWTLQQTAGALDRQGVPFLVIKGSVLAEQIYGDPVVRPFHDVDLVVRDDQLPAAEAALTSLGYRFLSVKVRQLKWEGFAGAGPIDAVVPAEAGREALRRFHQHFVFVPPDNRLLPVELHWRISRPGLTRLEPSAIWNHVQSGVVAGVPVKLLTPDAMLVHAATHAMSDSVFAFRLLHLVDIAWMLDRLGPRLDVTNVWRLAGEWGVRGDVACALQALEEGLGEGRVGSFDYRRYQGPLRRSLFRRVANTRALLEREIRNTSAGSFCRAVGTEVAWELSTRRRPRNAARTIAGPFKAVPHLLGRRRRRTNAADRFRQTIGDDLASLASTLGTLADVESLPSRPDANRTHQSFLLSFEDGRRVKGRWRTSDVTAEYLRTLSSALTHLPAPRVLAHRGGAVVFEWIEGTPVTPDLWTPDVLRRCGALQAAIHATAPRPHLASRADPLGPGWQEALDRRIRALALAGKLPNEMGRRAFQIAIAHAPASAERGCTHGGFSADHLVIDSSARVYLVDNDPLVIDTIDLDLGRTWHLWPLNRDLRQAFIEGYSEHRRLDAFLAHLPFWTILASVEVGTRDTPRSLAGGTT